MTPPTEADSRLLTAWSRDLSVCTAAELRERWSGTPAEAVDRLDPLGFEGRLRDHHFLYFLAERVFFDNPEGQSLLHPPLHRDIFCAGLEEYLLAPTGGDAGFMNIHSRETLKSTFHHGVGPLGMALRFKHLYGRDARQALIHQKEMQASLNLMRLKSKVINHPWLRHHWPEFCSAEDFGTKLYFNWPCKSNRGDQTEYSIFASGIGADYVGLHFDMMWFSDLVNIDHRFSKVLREDVAAKHDALMYTSTFKGGKKLYDGTPYHAMDQWNKMMRANLDGKVIYKLITNGAIDLDREDVPADDPVRLIYPNHLTYEVLENLRNQERARSGNDDFWWLQMQCQVRSSRMIAAQWDWVRHCKQEEVPPTTYRCIFVDPAWKGTENSGEGDDACVAVLAFERRGSLMFMYVLDGVCSNEMTDAEGRAVVFQFMKRYGVVDVAPEERGGKAFKQSLRNEAQTRGAWINVLDLKSQQTNKGQRITSFLGEAQAGRVFLCEEAEADFKEKFRDQFENFPQLDHDDVLDCVSYGRDSNVTERVVPMWNAHTGPWWEQHSEDTPDYATRYCLR